MSDRAPTNPANAANFRSFDADLPHESIRLLSLIYGPKAIYPDRIDEGQGILTVKAAHLEQAVLPKDLDQVYTDLQLGKSETAIGGFNIKEQHNADHFKGKAVFPGHKNLRMAARALGHATNQLGCFAITHFDELRFSDSNARMAYLSFPGNYLEYSASNFQSSPDRTISADVSSRNGEKTTMTVNRLTLRPVSENTPIGLTSDQILEAATQTLGVIALAKISNIVDQNAQLKFLPLFESVGSANFTGDVHEGETITFIPELIESNEEGFVGNVQVFKDGVQIAEIKDIQARLAAYKTVMYMLERASREH